MFGQGLTTTARADRERLPDPRERRRAACRSPLVDGCTDADGTDDDRAAVRRARRSSRETAADETSQMLERVYQEGWLADEWNIPGYRVAAKTGTAQVPDGNGGYLKRLPRLGLGLRAGRRSAVRRFGEHHESR